MRLNTCTNFRQSAIGANLTPNPTETAPPLVAHGSIEISTASFSMRSACAPVIIKKTDFFAEK